MDRSRRRLALFALVVALPCLVLVGLAFHTLRQEEELAERRRADLEAKRAREVRDLVGSRLERIRLGIVAGEETPSVVLLAPVEEGGPVLPWERAGESPPGDPAFRSALLRAERVEIGARRPERAISLYRELVDAASTPVQEASARLLAARALVRAGRGEEAVREYRELLGMPLSVVDEEGVPFTLYAADRLLLEEGEREVVIERLSGLAGELDSTVSPLALHLLDDLLSEIQDGGGAVEEIRDATRRRLEIARRALAVRNDWEGLQATWSGTGSETGSGTGTETGSEAQSRGTSGAGSAPVRWIPHGSPPWLLARFEGSGGPLLAAVDPTVVLRRLAETRPDLAPLRLVTGWREDAVDLAPRVPGARLVLPELPAVEPRSAYRRVVLGALLAVLVATLASAFLLWHDIRREVRTAALRSRFVSSVSHELKTPLTSIRMFAESLSLGRPRDPERRREYLETIVGESERLSRLIDNVLDFSKIEQGRKEYELRPTELSAAAEAAVRALRYPLREHGFELTVEIDDEVPPVQGDPDALEQAALNLLGNAMKYSGDSSVIDLRVFRRDGHAVLEVEDRGIGIPPEERERIFEEFYRLGAEEQDVPGTGLGLTLVSHVAREHGGRVTVESEPGEGSTFGLWIPLEEESGGEESWEQKS